MELVLGFGELAGAALLLTAAITGGKLSDVISGRAYANWKASGGATGTAAAAGGATTSTGPGIAATGVASSVGVNPFSKARGLVIGRTDQGVDATMTPGSPILSPLAGTITAINPNWYLTQPQIVLQTVTGKFIYLAEQIVPSVHVGQQIQAGQQLATYASSGTGIEMGLASNAQGETLAQATTGYTEGQQTTAGQEFRKLLAFWGVNVG